MTISSSSGDVEIVRVVAAARNGDRGAVEWLFAELQPPLLRYLRSQDSRAAEDLAGEVWLAVATRLGNSKATGWTSVGGCSRSPGAGWPIIAPR